ncbi:MAG: bifunctional oligoribonuclease/PAP phosphatase NrnA [Candidatus Nanoarchaeia archaeon]
MGLNKADYRKIRQELDECSRPLYFFGDDADGLTSFLLLYKYKQEGTGVVVKAAPNLDERFIKKIEEYQPDKVFILDVPIVDQEFIDACRCPVIWIDHHPPVKRNKVLCFNPRNRDMNDNSATSEMCYHVVKDFLWVAAIGIVGDWQLSTTTEAFSKKYPDLLPSDINKPQNALFATKLGEMIRMCEAMLKGQTKKVLQNIKILTRIEDPYELLNGTTSRSRLLMKRYRFIKKQYDELLSMARKQADDGGYLIFVYQDNKMSFSTELSNELLYLYPDRTVIVAREKNEEMKCSFRTSEKNMQKALEKALVNIQGYGGGHEKACGGCIKKDDWERFLEQLKEELEKQ